MKYFAFFDIFNSISQTDESYPYMIAVFALFVIMLGGFTLITLKKLKRKKKENNSANFEAQNHTHELKPENPFIKRVD
ncbi:MAG: hypothetical protein K8S87_01670 [Planctomycetes bacterium]|nr:hypothetical protein [Planctomycetota bacterium]